MESPWAPKQISIISINSLCPAKIFAQAHSIRVNWCEKPTMEKQCEISLSMTTASSVLLLMRITNILSTALNSLPNSNTVSIFTGIVSVSDGDEWSES
jgi:hypothetical protein